MRWRTLIAALGEAPAGVLISELTVGLSSAALLHRLLGAVVIPATLPKELMRAVLALTRARTSLRWAASYELAPLWSWPLPPVPTASATSALALSHATRGEVAQLVLTALTQLDAAGDSIRANAPIAEIDTALTRGITRLRLAAAVLDTARATGPGRDADP